MTHIKSPDISHLSPYGGGIGVGIDRCIISWKRFISVYQYDAIRHVSMGRGGGGGMAANFLTNRITAILPLLMERIQYPPTYLGALAVCMLPYSGLGLAPNSHAEKYAKVTSWKMSLQRSASTSTLSCICATEVLKRSNRCAIPGN